MKYLVVTCCPFALLGSSGDREARIARGPVLRGTRFEEEAGQLHASVSSATLLD